MNKERKVILNDLKKYAIEGGEHKLMEYEIKHILAHINNLQNRIDKAIELKHNWQKKGKNSLIVFENNSLINFMNELEDILKGDDEN